MFIILATGRSVYYVETRRIANLKRHHGEMVFTNKKLKKLFATFAILINFHEPQQYLRPLYNSTLIMSQSFMVLVGLSTDFLSGLGRAEAISLCTIPSQEIHLK